MKLIVIALCLALTACAGVQPVQQPVPLTAPPSASTAPPETIAINIPNWPAIVYQKGEAFVILVVKNAAEFPIPKEFVFTRKDGEKIVMPMVQPDKPK
jgi:hypothetical protein